MTTDNEAAKIAGTLSAEELADLQAIADGKFDDNADYGDYDFMWYMPLWNKDLIARRYEHTYVTDLGKRVLAAHASVKAEEQVTEITAREFGEQKYLRKINLQECEVFDENGNRVVSMSTEEEFKDVYAVVLYSPKAGTWMEEHSADTKFTVQWLDTQSLEGQPPATADGSEADEPQTQAELCEREIVKIRSLTLKDDEYTGDLLAYAVGSPVGITMCVEARMKQIADLQSEVERLKKQIKKLKRKSDLDDGFIDHLTQESEE